MMIENHSTTVVVENQQEETARIMFLAPGTSEGDGCDTFYEGDPVIQICAGAPDHIVFECVGTQAKRFAEELHEVSGRMLKLLEYYEDDFDLIEVASDRSQDGELAE